MQSILSLQGRSAASEDTKTQLDLASNRVLAIATVHKQLHLSGSMEEVDIGDFLRRLCESLKHTAPAQIEAIKVTSATLLRRSDLATGLGLLVAELVTNSFKYAYPAGQQGSVCVDFRETENGWRLVVSDDGQGFPVGFDIHQSKGFGMKVVKAFVSRLNAKLTVSSRPGRTSFEVVG